MYAEPKTCPSPEKSNEKMENCAPLQNRLEPLASGIQTSTTEAKNTLRARRIAWWTLELQNPDCIECYSCKKQHPLSDIHKFAQSITQASDRTPCMKLDQKYRCARFVHPDFHLTVFRMVMKQHRQQKDCTELLRLLSYDSGVIMDGSQVKQMIATPNIIGAQLFMRVQTAYVVPPARDWESRLHLANRNYLKCPHSTRHSPNNICLARKIVEGFHSDHVLPEDRQTNLWNAQCDICQTIFQVGLQRFKKEGSMLFVTKWVVCGEGLSPIKSDIDCCVGPWKKLPYRGLKQRRLPEKLTIEGRDLEATSVLTPEEREELFGKSNSAEVKAKRSKDVQQWRRWLGCPKRWLHQQ